MLLISAVQQNDRYIIYIYIFFFHVLFHYGLSQDTEYSSLCCTVGPCFLSSLTILTLFCMSQTHTKLRELKLNCLSVYRYTYVKKESLLGGTNIGSGTNGQGLYGDLGLSVFYLEIAQMSRLSCL